MDTIPIVPTKEEVFSLDDIEYGVKRLANGKAKDIKGYQNQRTYPHPSHTQALQFSIQVGLP